MTGYREDNPFSELGERVDNETDADFWLQHPLQRPPQRDADVTAPRLLAVAERIAEGKTYRVIAAELGLQTGTVKEYARRLFRILNVNSKLGVAVWWTRRTEGKPAA